MSQARNSMTGGGSHGLEFVITTPCRILNTVALGSDLLSETEQSLDMLCGRVRVACSCTPGPCVPHALHATHKVASTARILREGHKPHKIFLNPCQIPLLLCSERPAIVPAEMAMNQDLG
jgi:hypothetical protein